MKRMLVTAIVLLAGVVLLASEAIAKKPTAEAGKQFITARYTQKAPVIDGAIGPGEYSAAVPLHGNFAQPTTAPGVIGSWDTNPENPDDLSFTIYAVYDDLYLYIAVDVADDIIIHDLCGDGKCLDVWPDSWDFPSQWYCVARTELDWATQWYDDDVEIYVDGDKVGNDITLGDSGPEGFQVLTDANGDTWTNAWLGEVNVDAVPGPRPRGYLVEHRIELASIDVIDGDDYRAAGPGDAIGFNAVAGDDDNGSYPYNSGQERCDCPFESLTCAESGYENCPNPWDDPQYAFWEPDDVMTDSFGRWDGRRENSYSAIEDHWGTLYFEPPTKGAKSGKAVAGGLESSSWGDVKNRDR